MAPRLGRLRKPQQAVSLLAFAAVMLAGCASPATTNRTTSSPTAPAPSVAASGAPTSRPSPTVALAPVGLAVIGHSGATGYDSDPQQPGTDIRSNSWATGANPAVQSIYLRMLAEDPTIEGHAANLSISGSNVDSLISQARQLVTQNPPPTIVLIQTIDNDMQCDGTDEANFEPYRAKLTQVLDTLTQGVPSIQVFIVSQWADVETYDRVVFALNPAHLTGSGPCDTVDAETGQILPSREVSLQELVDAYFAIVTDVCENYPGCRTDGGAMQHMDLSATDLSTDFNHLSVAGHAKMAAIVWELLASE